MACLSFKPLFLNQIFRHDTVNSTTGYMVTSRHFSVGRGVLLRGHQVNLPYECWNSSFRLTHSCWRIFCICFGFLLFPLQCRISQTFFRHMVIPCSFKMDNIFFGPSFLWKTSAQGLQLSVKVLVPWCPQKMKLRTLLLLFLIYPLVCPLEVLILWKKLCGFADV